MARISVVPGVSTTMVVALGIGKLFMKLGVSRWAYARVPERRGRVDAAAAHLLLALPAAPR